MAVPKNYTINRRTLKEIVKRTIVGEAFSVMRVGKG